MPCPSLRANVGRSPLTCARGTSSSGALEPRRTRTRSEASRLGLGRKHQASAWALCSVGRRGRCCTRSRRALALCTGTINGPAAPACRFCRPPGANAQSGHEHWPGQVRFITRPKSRSREPSVIQDHVNDARVLTGRLRAFEVKNGAKLDGICEYVGESPCRNDAESASLMDVLSSNRTCHRDAL
jgi:hypothetical protein